MEFSYWFKRGLKTICCIFIYYIILFGGSLLFYPQGDFLDLSRGDKIAQSMSLSVLIVYIIFSGVVCVNRFCIHKEWFSKLSGVFTYFVFSLSHFIFLFFMNMFIPVVFIEHILVFIVFCTISYILGRLVIKDTDCIFYEVEDESYDEPNKII